MKIIVRTILLCFLLLSAIPLSTSAAEFKDSFPRLANYYLHWEINDYETAELARWDVLILDMEVQENSPEQVKEIRRLNPNIKILAYITSQEIMDNFIYDDLAWLRPKLKEGLLEGWYLLDPQGNKVSNWPGTYMLNITDGAPRNSSGERFNDYLPSFIAKNIASSGLFDGVFYDNSWGDVAWINGGNIDLDNDGKKDGAIVANQQWASGFQKIIDKTRTLTGNDFLIVGNGRVHWPYQSSLNGMMLEGFPSSWENGGTWSGSMATYLKLFQNNKQPNLSIINVYDGSEKDFSLMRYGLGSALLGDGFFSYDSSVFNHGQSWWYDEYDFKLGSAKSTAYNALTGTKIIGAGLWRRDFQKGSVFVNSDKKVQSYIFSKESFSRFNGNQDHAFNNGSRINSIKLQPNEAIILQKNDQHITDSTFTNGYFYRFFDNKGNQIKPAAFSFLSAYPGGAEVYSSSYGDISAYTDRGALFLEKNGKNYKSINPFSTYKGKISLTINKTDDGLISGIVVSAGAGGGPQILFYDTSGKLRGNFFAYDKNLRTGANIASGDLDGDGKNEIVAAPAKGGSEIRVFSSDGKLKHKFLSYGTSFKGGVSVAIGDVSGDDIPEIITVPASNGGPQVRVFDINGKVLGGFFAFDKNKSGEFRAVLSDIDGNGIEEIIIGQKIPY